MFHFLARLLGFAPQVTHVHHRDRRVRLTLEVLEGRIVPASFDVWNLNDAGDGSLRAAIGGANGSGDTSNTIVFIRGARPLSGTIELQSALPQITSNVDILAGSAGGPIGIQGNATAQNPYRIFTIDPGVNASINDLTIEGGFTNDVDGGGGIWNTGNLSLTDDVIQGNTAAQGPGGGISNATSGSLCLDGNDTIQFNNAPRGGGIANGGYLTTCGSGTAIIANNATNGDGGGIYNIPNSTVDLANAVQISGNTATGNGGGVSNYGTFQMDGGFLSNNDAFNGGGLYNAGTGTVTLDSSLMVQKNQATFGGGLYLANNSTTTLNTITIQNNVLVGVGGSGKGIYKGNPITYNPTAVTNPDGTN